jgi:hypothetical protein
MAPQSLDVGRRQLQLELDLPVRLSHPHPNLLECSNRLVA